MEENSFEEVIEDRFPDEVVDDVDGLLWLGYLEDVVEFCGHEFVIRTLRLEEEMLAALVSKEYIDTLGQAKAWIAAQVALALVSVDGDDSFCPPAGPNKKEFARARFKYVSSSWFEPTVNYIYSKYAELIERQATALEEMENLSQESRTIFTASPDSLTDKADSIPPEIMDLLEDEEE
jgi:hypothetical protein